MESTQKVYSAICAITDELSKVGIAKDKKNQQQNYSFRGIDDVYCVLSSLLAKHHLCILPRVVEHSIVERETQKGGALFTTTVRMEFDLVSAEDGSKHTVATLGEAMDTADKSSNKAQSAAYKYMAFQTFCIPTEGDNDADAQTHEVKAKREDGVDVDALLKDAGIAAGNGVATYKQFWNSLPPKLKNAIGEKRHADFKAKAEEADSYVPS